MGKLGMYIARTVLGYTLLVMLVLLALGALFTAGCVGLVRDPSPRRSMQVFAFSISYITILFGAIAVDVLVSSGW